MMTQRPMMGSLRSSGTWFPDPPSSPPAGGLAPRQGAAPPPDDLLLLGGAPRALGRPAGGGGAGFDFDEGEHGAVPADEVNLAPPVRGAVVAPDDGVALAAQVPVGVGLAADARFAARLGLAGGFRGQAAPRRQPVHHAEHRPGKQRHSTCSKSPAGDKTPPYTLLPPRRDGVHPRPLSYVDFSTWVRASSRRPRAQSTCSWSTMSGGIIRRVFGPQPSRSSPRWKAASTTASRSLGARSRVCLSLTSSRPIISPRPRTSPTSLCRRGQSASLAKMYSPNRRAFSMSPPSSKRMVASDAATATGFPPKVEACAPGGQFIRSARAMQTPSGRPEAIPLATQRMSGA